MSCVSKCSLFDPSQRRRICRFKQLLCGNALSALNLKAITKQRKAIGTILSSIPCRWSEGKKDFLASGTIKICYMCGHWFFVLLYLPLLHHIRFVTALRFQDFNLSP